MEQLDFQDAFRKNAKARRLALGLTQTDLAEKIQSSQPYVADFEAGRKSPHLKTLQRIVEALDMPRPEIFEDLSENSETAA